jgi:ribose transport system ATP-binding protein
MKEEVLRLEHVTTDDFEMTNLDNLSMHIFKGEIAGLLPIDEQGRKKLLEVLCSNAPLKYGRVYLEDELVNSYLKPAGKQNRVYVISGRSRLIGTFSIAENLFVLRSGFRQYVVNRKLLYREAKRLLEAAGLALDPGALADTLTDYERVVIELLKAVVQRARLIVVDEIGTILSSQEILRLRGLLARYIDQGFSFLYIGNHHEEVLPMCGRTMLMKGGRIVRIINGQEATDGEILQVAGSVRFPELYLQIEGSCPREKAGEARESGGIPAFEFHDVTTDYLDHLSFSVMPGECIVLLDRGIASDEEILNTVTDDQARWQGEIRCGGKLLQPGHAHLLDESIGVIREHAHRTMIFPDLTFLDNLCILTDRKVKNPWMQSRVRKSIRREYVDVFGSCIDETDLRRVPKKELYTLVYYRYYMLHPKVLFCVQPFAGADIYLREHILDLIRKMQERGIAVVILTVGQTDSCFAADRLILLEHGKHIREFQKEEFKYLLEHLYQAQ